jgi:ABC-type polysaccharide/polyol phosphate export permease
MPEFIIKIYDSQEHLSFPRFLRKNVREMRIYRFAWYNFVINNLRMRYRRSALGFLWSLLNPLLVMTIIAIVFAVIFKQDLREFSVYIFSGLVPWWYISSAILGGCQTIINGEGFLKKVYLPKILFPLVSVSVETANFFFSITSLFLLALLVGYHFHWTFLYLPVATFITFLFNLGLAIVLGVSTVYFRDLTQIMMVVFQALFYMVPIIYPVEAIPPQYQKLFLFNPFFYFINLYRKIIYNSAPLTTLDWLIPSALAIFSLIVGFFVLMKQDRDLIYRL